MADQVNSLEELSAVSGDVAPATAVVAEPREPVRDALGRAYATGKRKTLLLVSGSNQALARLL